MSYRITGEKNDPSGKVLSTWIRLNLLYFHWMKSKIGPDPPADLLSSAAYS
jgi:hypothetical protein